jgi:hypothetical protein
VDRIDSAVVMMWSLLAQLLRDSKEASCQAAVAHVMAHCQQLGIPSPSSDSGDYCRARNKLAVGALSELSLEGAAKLETQADPKWLWQGLHANLVDGSTFTKHHTPAIRTTTAAATIVHGKQPRHNSLSSGCQYVLAHWMLFSSGGVDPARSTEICRDVLQRVS